MSKEDNSREQLRDVKRIVVKVGTRVVTEDDGTFSLRRVGALVDAISREVNAGRELLLISSGAVGLGRETLGIDSNADLALRQAMAAVGQVRLIELYKHLFTHHGLVCAQVLLTSRDFESRRRYLNLRTALNAMLSRDIVPIINENDVVSTEEITFEDFEKPVFYDNDRLAMLVATKLDADLLLLLTNVEGVYERDPRGEDNVPLLHTIDPKDAANIDLGGPGDIVSRGGMKSKAEAAMAATQVGCHTIIASGDRHRVLSEVLSGQQVGTWFPANAKGINARSRWLAHASAPKAKLVLDDGAVHALLKKGASLLPVGLVRIEGEFEKGDVVELCDAKNNLLGRGIVHYSSDIARAKSSGKTVHTDESQRTLIRRENMVLY